MPELFQVIGAVLRDVTQARFMSDMYSRQISHAYERDSLLRQFPVPRVDIDEVEIDLRFRVKDVRVDPNRHTSRNAAIGSLFDQYSTSIVRDSMETVRRRLPGTRTGLEPAAKAALDTFEQRVLSDDNRQMLTGRLLRYLNDNVGTLLHDDGAFAVDDARADLGEVIDGILAEPDVSALRVVFPAPDWKAAFEEAKAVCARKLGEMAKDVAAVYDRYPDYLIDVEVGPEALKGSGDLSSIRIKSRVRNYRWSKVDVDPADMRSIRSLNPE